MQKNQIKYISSLYNKKDRHLEHMVILDGLRLIHEAFKGNGKINTLLYTNDFINSKKFNKYAEELLDSNIKSEIIKNSELRKISNNKNPQGIIALCDFIPMKISDIGSCQSNWIILDNISDPGNLGTILRTAEWFGIKNVLASAESVDLYNDKVLRAGMGAHFYINNIIQDKLTLGVEKLKDSGYSIIGSRVSGENINTIQKNKKWALVMGNEANGISNHIKPHIDRYVTIPKGGNVESLNVAIACGIILNRISQP